MAYKYGRVGAESLRRGEEVNKYEGNCQGCGGLITKMLGFLKASITVACPYCEEEKVMLTPVK